MVSVNGRHHVRKILLLLVILAFAAGAFAQRIYVGPTYNNPRWATSADFDGSILFCRGYYTMERLEPEGIGWFTDYPGADHNFMVRLAELTEVRVRFDEERIPIFVTVMLDDPLLYKCPVLFMSDVGTMGLRDDEATMLRDYLQRGGFIWTDDSWGSAAWAQWETQTARISSGVFVDVSPEHPLFHMLYTIQGGIWQQPHAEFWYGRTDDEGVIMRPQGETSERGADSAIPVMKAIYDEKGRMVVLSTHNTDIADGWEREDTDNWEYAHHFAAKSYALGVNIFLYAVSH